MATPSVMTMCCQCHALRIGTVCSRHHARTLWSRCVRKVTLSCGHDALSRSRTVWSRCVLKVTLIVVTICCQDHAPCCHDVLLRSRTLWSRRVVKITHPAITRCWQECAPDGYAVLARSRAAWSWIPRCTVDIFPTNTRWQALALKRSSHKHSVREFGNGFCFDFSLFFFSLCYLCSNHNGLRTWKQCNSIFVVILPAHY